MKIYYYKQQQNTFALFAKRSHKHKNRYIAASVLTLIALSIFVVAKMVNHQGPKQLTTLEQLPTANGDGYFQSLAQDAETQATTTNIQNNIQQNSLALEDTPKNPTQNQPVTLKVGTSTLSYTVKSKDTLGKIFKKAGVSQKELASVLKSTEYASALKHLKLGQKITLTLNEEKQLQQLSYVVDPTSTIVINRVKDNFKYAMKTVPLETRQGFVNFTVFGSVNAAAKKAGLDSKKVAQLAGIFKNSVDFNSKHLGDVVHVLYQSYYLNGKKVKDGEIIAAEYKTATNTYQAVRFTDPNGNSGYYAPDGTSMQKRFLPAPLKFTRISSMFNPKRWHPVLHRFRHHQGVDYAAPYGTPIKSVASGTIALLGTKGGYGNTIMIKHDSSYSTLYGHLSKYATNLKVGSHVQQGQLIGYVGSSGLATGPHLHFEFRINGVHRNPLTVALPNGKSITHAYRNKFHNEVKKLLARLDAHKKPTSGNI